MIEFNSYLFKNINIDTKLRELEVNIYVYKRNEEINY